MICRSFWISGNFIQTSPVTKIYVSIIRFHHRNTVHHRLSGSTVDTSWSEPICTQIVSSNSTENVLRRLQQTNSCTLTGVFFITITFNNGQTLICSSYTRIKRNNAQVFPFLLIYIEFHHLGFEIRFSNDKLIMPCFKVNKLEISNLVSLYIITRSF